MANLERWLLRFLVRRQVARGFNDGRELVAMYQMVRDAAMEIDDAPVVSVVLDAKFKQAKYEKREKWTNLAQSNVRETCSKTWG